MDPILIREWDNDRFHQRILELERTGYIALRETYSVTAEQNPETGYISHVYCIELYPAAPNTASLLERSPER